MTFRKLNFGSIAGGMIAGGCALAILYLLNNGIPRRGFRLVTLAALGGAALGNWIWQLALPSEQGDFGPRP